MQNRIISNGVKRSQSLCNAKIEISLLKEATAKRRFVQGIERGFSTIFY